MGDDVPVVDNAVVGEGQGVEGGGESRVADARAAKRVQGGNGQGGEARDRAVAYVIGEEDGMSGTQAATSVCQYGSERTEYLV